MCLGLLSSCRWEVPPGHRVSHSFPFGGFELGSSGSGSFPLGGFFYLLSVFVFEIREDGVHAWGVGGAKEPVAQVYREIS